MGTGAFNNFISSYCKYNSGHPHQLVLLFNGVSKEEEITPYLKIIAEKKIPFQKLIHYGSCHDLDAYFWAAAQLDSRYLLFLNSYSVILDEGWLERFMLQKEVKNVGIIGATGSWQSYYRTVFINNSWRWENARSVKENIRKFKLLIKASIYWRFLFPDFPNPHIRTNAFMMEREVMVSLKRKPIKKKFAAYKLESGVNSLTAQVLAKGMEVVVVDRWGRSYKKGEWAQARIFWKENQQDLLISDNQTRKYDQADEKTRTWLSLLAWGNRAQPPKS